MNAVPRMADLPDVLGVDEVAALLRVSKSSIYEAIREGRIPALRLRRRIVVPKRVIERILTAVEEGVAPLYGG